MSDTKTMIYKNAFVEKLRTELVVDRNAYDDLCELLQSLAEEWRGADLIDKQLMHYLYPIASIVQAMGDGLAKNKPEEAQELWNMSATLDALIGEECLWETAWRETHYLSSGE